MTPIYDLLLQGGTLIDPAQQIHDRRDIAFLDGKVAAIEQSLSARTATTVIDCRDDLVTPGLIDLHVHVFPGVSHYGIDPDRYCLAKGVTTAVDAGSAGADTFPGFRNFVIDVCDTRLFAHLNISSQGMLTEEIGELLDIRYANVPRALAMVEQHRDVILGIKVRLTKNALVSEASGIQPLHLAREAADAAGLPIMVHPQAAWVESLDDILAVMREGDILTHCFHAMPCGIFDERGKIRQSVWDAVERGVIFDVGHGAGSFSWDIVENALEQDFLPQTISSDLHIYNVEGPVFDLITTITKFRHLGLSLDDALAKVTSVPARIIGMEGEIGTLKKGAWGDAVVLSKGSGPIELVDSLGVVRTGQEQLVPKTVIKNGKVYKPTTNSAHVRHHH